jgi:nucleoside-diphosphate-sugar epimerase
MERFLSGWKPRNIVVTGGSGFLGQQFLKVCSEQGHRVVNMDISKPRNEQYQEIPYIQADLSDPMNANQAFTTAKYDYLDGKIDDVFHLAAIVSYTLPYRRLEGPNVTAAHNVAKECINNNAFLVHMSGTAVLGHVPTAIREDDQPNPVEDYGRSKTEAEKQIYHLSNSEGLKALIFRSTAPVGPGLETAGINGVYKMILEQPKILATKGSKVTYISTEDIARAFLFVAENQAAVYQGADSLDKMVYNLGVHKPLSDKEMAEHLIASILGEGKKKVTEVPHWVVQAGSYFMRTSNMVANAGRFIARKRRKEPGLCPSLARLMKGPHFQDYTKFEKYFESKGFRFNYPTPEEVLDTGVIHKFKTEWSHLEPPERTKKLIEKQQE